jgi:hypothetical protein
MRQKHGGVLVSDDVRGITEVDYQNWKRHPVSQFFLQHLSDRRDNLLSEMQKAWLAGGDAFENMQAEARGRALCLDEIATMPFAAFKEFYANDNKRK